MNEKEKYIKSQIETYFDLPFDVVRSEKGGDAHYIIIPKNDSNGLFELHLFFRQKIRLVIEIKPQKYAANMVNDMQNANADKIALFKSVYSQINKSGAVVELKINNKSYSSVDDDIWNSNWDTFEIRITKLPVTTIDEEFIETQIVEEWCELAVCLILSLLQVDFDNHEILGKLEGQKHIVQSIRYERNPINRKLCLEANGYNCKICGMNFYKKYGEIGKRFIHVHHIIPVSSYGNVKSIDPIKDLIPVCPNCHAMLHTSEPPLQPEELIMIIKGEYCGEIDTDKE